jgi:hypothetical protein
LDSAAKIVKNKEKRKGRRGILSLTGGKCGFVYSGKIIIFAYNNTKTDQLP